MIRLKDHSYLLGSDKSHATLLIDNPAVSRCHAEIRFTKGGYLLMDMGSTNGSSVNGTGIRGGGCFLYDGDIVRLANEEFLFRYN